MNQYTLSSVPSGFGSTFKALVAAGKHSYERRLHLQRLLPVTSTVIEDQSTRNCQWIISRLIAALRQERNRSANDHWAYSLNRHIALLQAYRGELRILNDHKALTHAK